MCGGITPLTSKLVIPLFFLTFYTLGGCSINCLVGLSSPREYILPFSYRGKATPLVSSDRTLG